MDKRFLRAFLTPRATKLCGHELYPWCLKHRLWLTALNHPIVVGGDATPAEIVFFARVCAEKPVGKASLMDKWQAIRLARPAYRYAALDTIRQHIRLDCWPKFWERAEHQGEGARNNGIPWVLSVLTNLTRNGHSLEEALNLPECQAIWLATSINASKGAKVEVLTSEDEELLDELTRMKPPADQKTTP